MDARGWVPSARLDETGGYLGEGPTLRKDKWKVGHLRDTAWSRLRKEFEDPGSRAHELDISGVSEREILNNDGSRKAKKVGKSSRVSLCKIAGKED